ncbi:MAG: glycosyltransferase family 4 protein [Candidatus Scalindua sp.]|nr:glycosyltransferase family 4 protein [Candidatus Scalindua sp.]MDR4503327.1 glycosyltransferase family 4 protein [Candidatus Scalindua sp.]
MRIWIVNPFDPLPGESFRPGRYAFIANMLSEKGHKVTWWTSNFFHMSKQYRSSKAKTEKINANLTIKQIPTPAYKKNIGFARLYNHYLYGRRFEAEALKAKERPDIILASIPPLESADAALRVGEKFNSKIVIDIQDLWPDLYLFILPGYLKPIGKIVLWRLFQKVDSIYRNADALMAVSKDYFERGLSASRNSKPGKVLHLGIDLCFFDSQKITPNNFLHKKEIEDVWITYIGTFGRTYDLDTILDAAVCFMKNSNVKFIIAGDGPEYPRLKKKAVEEGIHNIAFTGMLGYSDMVHVLGLSTVGLNAYAPDAPQTFPNKVFDYFAASLPVINSIPGELQGLLDEKQAGLQYKAGDVHSLVNAIRIIINDKERSKQMGKNARKLVEERFDRNKEYLKLEEFLTDLVGQ